MDAGGGFGGLVLPSGAYVVKGDRAETRLRPPQARRGVFALGAMPRSYM
jgi:hypothetical protein